MTMILPYLWYPVFVGLAVVVFAVMLAAGVSPAGAAYAPIALVAVVILVLERWFPERLEWRPRWPDVKADAAFILILQVILPRALAALCVLAIAQWMHEHARSPWWPHAWPLVAQTIAMVLAVDLMR